MVFRGRLISSVGDGVPRPVPFSFSCPLYTCSSWVNSGLTVEHPEKAQASNKEKRMRQARREHAGNLLAVFIPFYRILTHEHRTRNRFSRDLSNHKVAPYDFGDVPVLALFDRAR